jgi:hypothetical protein
MFKVSALCQPMVIVRMRQEGLVQYRMSAKKTRSWLWTSGDSRGSTPPFPRCIHHWQSEMVHPHRQCGEEGTTGGWRNLAWPLRPSQAFIDEPLKGYCLRLSPPGMATALSATTRLSREWCGLPKASPVAHCLPFRTSTAPGVTGRPRRSELRLVHPTTIHKTRSVQVNISWENSFYLKAIRLLNSHH